MDAVLLKSELQEIRQWAKENDVGLDDIFYIQAETPEKFLELNPTFVRLYVEALAEDGISYAEFCAPYKEAIEPEFSRHLQECLRIFGIKTLLEAALSPKFSHFTCVFLRRNIDGESSAW